MWANWGAPTGRSSPGGRLPSTAHCQRHLAMFFAALVSRSNSSWQAEHFIRRGCPWTGSASAPQHSLRLDVRNSSIRTTFRRDCSFRRQAITGTRPPLRFLPQYALPNATIVLGSGATRPTMTAANTSAAGQDTTHTYQLLTLPVEVMQPYTAPSPAPIPSHQLLVCVEVRGKSRQQGGIGRHLQGMLSM